jgi:hypothetical protein
MPASILRAVTHAKNKAYWSLCAKVTYKKAKRWALTKAERKAMGKVRRSDAHASKQRKAKASSTSMKVPTLGATANKGTGAAPRASLVNGHQHEDVQRLHAPQQGQGVIDLTMEDDEDSDKDEDVPLAIRAACLHTLQVERPAAGISKKKARKNSTPMRLA